MNKYMDVIGKLSFALLAAWVVFAGLGMTEMPGTKKEAVKKQTHKRAKGDRWQQSVTMAPYAEDGLAYPANLL